MSGNARICLLGLGEVGQILADDLPASPDHRIAAFDVQFDDATSAPTVAAKARPNLIACTAAAESAEEADVIISAVTASQAAQAARSVTGSLKDGAFFLDLNSVSPATSATTATLIDGAGGRFVEGAVMSPIGPKRIATPILLGGPFANEFLTGARALGFTATRVISDQIGAASATKMARSVLIKGIEALLAESLTTARRYGVEDAVLESLGDLLPDEDWRDKARYMITRSLQHGNRRAEEMREAAATVTDAGVEDWMSSAIVERQQWAAQFAESVGDDLDDILDTFLGSREEPRTGTRDG